MWRNEHDDEHATTHSHDFSLSAYLSFQELLDYLVQLLGSENDKVRALAENIGLFQQGADLTLSAPPLQPNSTIPDTPSHSTTATATTTTPKKAAAAPTTKTVEPQKPTPQPKHTQKKKQSTQPRAAKTPPRRQTNTPSNPTPAEASPKPPQTNHNKSSKNKTTTSIVLPKKSRPTRGEPKFVCGCFGTFHKPLTNCLFCGRIACEKEGYTYCAFCGYMVERPPPGGSSSTADKHKERLLRFDREYAKRTFVLDDQADFFTTQQARNWVGSEEERKAMEEKEEEQLLASRQRPKMQLQIDL